VSRDTASVRYIADIRPSRITTCGRDTEDLARRCDTNRRRRAGPQERMGRTALGLGSVRAPSAVRISSRFFFDGAGDDASCCVARSARIGVRGSMASANPEAPPRRGMWAGDEAEAARLEIHVPRPEIGATLTSCGTRRFRRLGRGESRTEGPPVDISP
jgi:hypothetical protein